MVVDVFIVHLFLEHAGAHFSSFAMCVAVVSADSHQLMSSDRSRPDQTRPACCVLPSGVISLEYAPLGSVDMPRIPCRAAFR
jgi:hypothetical protein